MSYYIIGLLLSLMSWSCSDDAETGREEIPVETDGGYLFAHMTNANYGKLYYAVSRDGINWETLNKAGSSIALTLDILIFVRDMTELSI